MDTFRIRKLIEVRYGNLEYFNSKNVRSQKLCFIRFSNPDTFSYIMNQEIILIDEEVTRVIPADIKSHQFLQEIKFKPAICITDLLKKITPRELLAAFKYYKAKSVFILTCHNGFRPLLAIVMV